MANQFTNPVHHHYRYLGRCRWERVDPYHVPDEYGVLHLTDDFRRYMVYFYFRNQDGKLFSDPSHNATFPGLEHNNLDELPVGAVVRVHRDWKDAFKP
jgi:hypothetical protein